MEEIDYLKTIPLSTLDVLNLLDNKVNVVIYKDLKKFKSIDQLLEPYNCCIILYESKPKFGHWCSIIKYGNNIEYFNPYGGDIDNSLDNIDNNFKKNSNQDYPYLSKLFVDSNYNLHFNEFKFQKRNNNVNTCGRHCVVRCYFKNYDIYEYKDILDELKGNMDYDDIVVILTE